MSKNGDNRNIRVLQFLDAYEKQESLWNPALESYKNKTVRDEAYMQIIRELNVPSLTIHDVKLKVKSIRTTYTKELRLLTKHKEDGKTYSPKLFWFNRANAFLRNVSLSRDKRLNFTERMNIQQDSYKPCVIDYIAEMSHPHIGTEPSDVSNEDVINTTTSSFEYKVQQTADTDVNIQEDLQLMNGQLDENRINSTHSQQNNFQSHIPATIISSKYTDTSNNIPSISVAPHSTLITSDNTGDDEYDIFCHSVAAQLRSISDTYSRSVAKLKIQQILFEAETGHYRNSPCITIPVTQHINNL